MESTRRAVLGAHGAGVGQTRLIELVDVIGVFALAEHLLAHVDTEGALAHTVVVAALQALVDPLFAAEHRSGQRNALDNLFVAGAAADVAADGVLDLLLGGLGVLGDERRTRHDHAGDAKTALHGTHGAKGVHKGLAHVLGQALDGHDVAAGGKSGGQYACLDGRAVYMDGAGTAGALGAAVLSGMDVQVVAQVAEQRLVLSRRAFDAVNGKSEFLCMVIPFYTPAAMPVRSWMAPCGQTTAHMPHDRQSAPSIWAQLSSMRIAPAGHFLAHMPQPMQLVSQILRAMAPLSVLLQRTRMFW